MQRRELKCQHVKKGNKISIFYKSTDIFFSLICILNFSLSIFLIFLFIANYNKLILLLNYENKHFYWKYE